MYFFNGTRWVEVTKLTSADGKANDAFGRSVSIDGHTVMIGAPDADVGAKTDEGAVYVYTLEGTSWIQKQKLTAITYGAALDHFGSSLSISGNNAIIGSPYADVDDNGQQGAAYMFEFAGTTWYLKQRITASDGATAAGFGWSVSISGNHAIVGAPTATVTSSQQGAAYVYFYNNVLWQEEEKLTAADGLTRDNFGTTVSISGDYAIVGSAGDDIAANNDQGSAYLFRRTSSEWRPLQKFSHPAGSDKDGFGHSISLYNKRFVIGESGGSAQDKQGKACFGTIN
jgi:hypothetical protein